MQQQTKTPEVYRVGISGSYGGLNLGDEAILQGIVAQLRRSLPVEITVFSRDAEDTRRRHPGVARVVPARSLARDAVRPEIERLDLLILGGGGILFDEEAKVYLREVDLALEKRVPVMTYAISAGPLKTPEAQKLVRESLSRVDVVTVREPGALKVLEEIGVKRDIVVTADPALLLEPEPLAPGALEREGLDPARRLIGMSVREPGAAAPDIDEAVYHGLLANAADYMVERFDADVVLIPMEPKMLDVRHCHAVIAQMLRAQRATVLKGEYSSGQMLSLVGRLAFAVGMRLHFLIFAALQGVPFVALPYSSKVEGFLADMKMVVPPLHQVNAGRLLAYIDQYWDRRAALQKSIKKLVPALQKRALETNEIAVRLLTGRPARSAAAVTEARA
ncbi:polysaccharide pyruvyl transferase [Sulfurifustis variabilis]|uniref:Polysaccharide pyruvyl transferase n=1 Tax=Sulfurifustis variabilis TaxID=1675686 RepID=A0A1B4V330_9GAMM|nr:polysaccharide pyruvyl transferase family protein [Sulfurifustis variabilis]BAU47959.1 polysaccharide pyruvyl transferase [Sulfurifustis variabilis]